MGGSLFCFAIETAGYRQRFSFAIELSRHEKMPTSRLGEEAGPHRVDGGGAERGRVSTDDVAHRQPYCTAWRGSWFIVSNACVVPLPAATVCYTLALLSGPDGRAMCCLQHA